jgi:uncharacterized cupredoxin-like copper-binding protein
VIRAATLAMLAVAASFALAACGSSNDNDTTAASTPAATTGGAGGQTVDISETEFKLTTPEDTVKAGQVTFNVKNDGQTTHGFEIEGPGDSVDVEEELEPDLQPGQSGNLTVDLSKPGTYEYYCPVDGHKDKGMEGEITVQ